MCSPRCLGPRSGARTSLWGERPPEAPDAHPRAALLTPAMRSAALQVWGSWLAAACLCVPPAALRSWPLWARGAAGDSLAQRALRRAGRRSLFIY